MNAIGEEIAGKEVYLCQLTSVGIQKRQDDIRSADLRPVLKRLAEIDSCNDFAKYSLVAKSSTHANRFAEHLEDLSALGLEKTRKMQRGYTKVL